MDDIEINKQIRVAFETVLEHKDFKLTRETTAMDVDGWESVTQMLIINEIEQRLHIKFKLMDLMNMNNIGDLTSIVKQELINK